MSSLLARSFAVGLLFSCLVLGFSSTASGQLVTGSWNLEVEVVQGNPEDDDFGVLTGSTFPFLSSLSRTAGNSSNDTDYDFEVLDQEFLSFSEYEDLKIEPEETDYEAEEVE